MRRPIFVTPNPLLIAGVREVLSAAGMPADPRIVAPEGLHEMLADSGGGLVILDGQALPHGERLAQLCRAYPAAQFVIWAAQPTAGLLRIALECGVHGLLSTRLPLEEASNALLRICQGERILRFDADSGAISPSKPMQLSARERHVLMVLAGGASNAGIAADLHTTASTVKGCLARLFRKTGARNRRELAQLGHSLLLLAEPPKDTGEAASFDAGWMLEKL
ncbi:MAG TPA: LuxR C-terminal-related transcriptional regulator [Bryobacteraceae bacterium]|jgi:DNA-binding NarL/FixJ family response regulator|nr:LuxR C-terminal-related transcriptional regulator [Bryobacteraceae bacterium]